MNAIPFVVIFISVIALAWSSLMQSTISSKRTTQGFVKHMAALNAACTKIERDYFQAAKKPEKKESKPTDRSEKTYSSPRLNTRKESSKLFLSSNPSKIMTDAFEELLNLLYEEFPFYDKRMTVRICDELFPMINEQFELTDLTFKDDQLQEAWYKMLRGDGCSPLKRYISMQDNSSLIYARYASYLVLSALLGQDVADEIISREEAKYFEETDKQSLLAENEFEQVLSNHNQTSLKSYMSFASKPKVIRIIEGKNQDLTLEIKTSLNPTEENVES